MYNKMSRLDSHILLHTNVRLLHTNKSAKYHRNIIITDYRTLIIALRFSSLNRRKAHGYSGVAK